MQAHVEVSYWKPRGSLGGLTPAVNEADATCAIVTLPTLRDRSVSFEFPTERESFHAFMAGISHGLTLGEHNYRNKVRSLLGVEVLTKMPTIPGPVHHGR